MMSSKTQGEVITFYSYKGGTGRTMSLANVACVLAQRYAKDKGVLMVDWDLEAPGLHRFFRDWLAHRFPINDEGEREFDRHPGLLDLFEKLDAVTREGKFTEEQATALFDKVRLKRFILETDIPSLHLLKAGRFDEKYPARVATFGWEALYQRAPWLIRSFAERLAQQYDYVLIDARTGLTDISGICTMLMPEKLVVVFTPNRQSLTGMEDMIRQATNYRRRSDDLRPLIVFPLPSRIEATRPLLHKDWRHGNPEKRIDGYQPQFESLFKEVYDLPECHLQDYFDEVQIQQIPDYAYGEQIAVLIEGGGDRLSLTRSYENFTERLVGSTGPWAELTRRRTALADVLIIKRRRDSSQAGVIALELSKRGLEHLLWTKRDVPPGQRAEDALREFIPDVNSVAIIIGPEVAGWQEEDLSPFIKECLKAGRPVIPVLLPGVDKIPPELSSLQKFQEVRFVKRLDEPEALEMLKWGITGKRPMRMNE